MTKALNLEGLTFNRLTVIRRTENDEHGKSMWECQCSCGKTAIRSGSKLKKGIAKSCGCLKSEALTKHGLSRNRTYRIWVGLIDRCTSPSSKDYPRYGGSGITVCDEWLEYRNFLDNMGECDDLEKSIDRIDNTKGYSPSNCRWATRKQQMRNRSNNINLTYNGITKTASEWANEKNMNLTTLLGRIKSGWSVENALNITVTPANGAKSRQCPNVFGETSD